MGYRVDCFKDYLKAYGKTLEKNARSLLTLPENVRQRCSANTANDDQNKICLRTSLASLRIMVFLNSLRRQPRDISFETPDLKRVKRTNLDYPSPQCRLDTFFHGALCTHEAKDPIDQREESQSGCMEQVGFYDALRPSCWYLPYSVVPH